MPFRSAEAERVFIARVPGLPQEQESVGLAMIGRESEWQRWPRHS
jgi:hypothetical protein